jgi:hypothetical protein
MIFFLNDCHLITLLALDNYLRYRDSELIVVDYRARIRGYFVSLTEGFERGTEFALAGTLTRGITAVDYSSFHASLVFAGYRADRAASTTPPALKEVSSTYL